MQKTYILLAVIITTLLVSLLIYGTVYVFTSFINETPRALNNVRRNRDIKVCLDCSKLNLPTEFDIELEESGDTDIKGLTIQRGINTQTYIYTRPYTLPSVKGILKTVLASSVFVFLIRYCYQFESFSEMQVESIKSIQSFYTSSSQFFTEKIVNPISSLFSTYLFQVPEVVETNTAQSV